MDRYKLKITQVEMKSHEGAAFPVNEPHHVELYIECGGDELGDLIGLTGHLILGVQATRIEAIEKVLPH